jgi:hypothetical protein
VSLTGTVPKDSSTLSSWVHCVDNPTNYGSNVTFKPVIVCDIETPNLQILDWSGVPTNFYDDVSEMPGLAVSVRRDTRTTMGVHDLSSVKAHADLFDRSVEPSFSPMPERLQKYLSDFIAHYEERDVTIFRISVDFHFGIPEPAGAGARAEVNKRTQPGNCRGFHRDNVETTYPLLDPGTLAHEYRLVFALSQMPEDSWRYFASQAEWAEWAYLMLAGGTVEEYRRRADEWLGGGGKGHLQKDFLPNANYSAPQPGFAISTRAANLRKCWIRKRLGQLWKPPLSNNVRFEEVYRRVLDEAAAIAKARGSPLTSDDVAGLDADASTDDDEAEDGED